MIEVRNQEAGSSQTLRIAAIIPAAGLGTRMGVPVPKQFLEIAGEPVLLRTVRIFFDLNDIDRVVVAVHGDHRQVVEEMFRRQLPSALMTRLMVTSGGATRQDSVFAGLKILPPEIDMVIVHDAARPLVSRDIIDRCLHGAIQSGAAIAAIPVKDTLKQVSAAATIVSTLDRSGLWQAQTPQAVRRDVLEKVFALARRDAFVGTDEASLLEHAGIPVTVVLGGEENFKITRPGDLELAAELCREQSIMKIGHGFDAHELTKDRPLILGGVTIPFDFGLSGHSDADVLTHALIDAILGALGDGDIGSHFPDIDEQWKDISSLKLLSRVIKRVEEKRLTIGNADLTVICQQPKLAPFLEKMRGNLSAVCGVLPAAVNVKATTTEKMGYTGRGEGIAAHAVVLLTTSRKGRMGG